MNGLAALAPDLSEMLRRAADCTIDHDALKANDLAWSLLEPRGIQDTFDDTPGEPRTLELRNCPCGSTLCRPFEVNP